MSFAQYAAAAVGQQEAVAAGGPLWSWSSGADGAFSDAEIDQAGTWTVASNQLTQTANYGVRGIQYNGTIGDNQKAEAVFYDPTDHYDQGLRVNCTAAVGTARTSTGSGYILQLRTGGTWYFSRDGTEIFGFGSQAYTFTTGDKFTLTVVDGTVSWYQNDVLMDDYVDGTPLTGGQPELYVQPGVNTSVFDDIVFDTAS